ncbi:erythropoietin receptor isoform X2 [Phyllopteryx taeniolatus]|uniref:erythropoietin receptor isoform X2 n=1 Tax=Phyllopteryx taeniolatus TaxID=161469 RepID=UPI002AD3A39C|nr:erythropoietin receptor isoform X2 [Phyllopteryx taeniolatus]
MTCDHLRRLLALSIIACVASVASGIPGSRNFQRKVAITLEKEPETPKCFAERKKDFTCFWEEDEERAGPVEDYSFTYTYQNTNSSECPLTARNMPGGKTLYSCHLDQASMFVPMDIEIRRDGNLIHNRSLLAELFFLLDPPANVTVSRTGQEGQLNVSWIPPPLKHMDDSMMYEVSYATLDSHTAQVEVVQASSRMILRSLQPGTKYTVRVRAKLDGISYNGYWSLWSDPVFMETPPAELNPLIVFLIFITSFILMVLSFAVLVSNRRFLRKKIWPTIPTPDGRFQGLFTDYGGDFQEWLSHTTGGLCSTPALFYNEEYPTSLEVLSELSLKPPLPPPPLPPKMSSAFTLQYTEEDVQKGLDLAQMPQNHWLMENLSVQNQHPVPCSQSSRLESQDTYVTLTENNHSQENNTLPLEVLLAFKKTMLTEAH